MFQSCQTTILFHILLAAFVAILAPADVGPRLQSIAMPEPVTSFAPCGAARKVPPETLFRTGEGQQPPGDPVLVHMQQMEQRLLQKLQGLGSTKGHVQTGLPYLLQSRCF